MIFLQGVEIWEKTRYNGKYRTFTIEYKISHGDVLDLTGRSVEIDCESERCSRLSTSKTN